MTCHDPWALIPWLSLLTEDIKALGIFQRSWHQQANICKNQMRIFFWITVGCQPSATSQCVLHEHTGVLTLSFPQHCTSVLRPATYIFFNFKKFWLLWTNISPNRPTHPKWVVIFTLWYAPLPFGAVAPFMHRWHIIFQLLGWWFFTQNMSWWASSYFCLDFSKEQMGNPTTKNKWGLHTWSLLSFQQ